MHATGSVSSRSEYRSSSSLFRKDKRADTRCSNNLHDLGRYVHMGGGSGFSFFAGNMAAVAPINKRQVGTQCQCLSGETPVWQPGRLRNLEPMRRTKMPWFTGTQVNRSGSKLDTWTIPVEKTSPFLTVLS